MNSAYPIHHISYNPSHCFQRKIPPMYGNISQIESVEYVHRYASAVFPLEQGHIKRINLATTHDKGKKL